MNKVLKADKDVSKHESSLKKKKRELFTRLYEIATR